MDGNNASICWPVRIARILSACSAVLPGLSRHIQSYWRVQETGDVQVAKMLVAFAVVLLSSFSKGVDMLCQCWRTNAWGVGSLKEKECNATFKYWVSVLSFCKLDARCLVLETRIYFGFFEGFLLKSASRGVLFMSMVSIFIQRTTGSWKRGSVSYTKSDIGFDLGPTEKWIDSNPWQPQTNKTPNKTSWSSWSRALLGSSSVYLTSLNNFSSVFREAIALAKVRLSPLDPVLFDLYSAWARKLETENSFEQAAKWYVFPCLPNQFSFPEIWLIYT